jgi:hypothetical protein
MGRPVPLFLARKTTIEQRELASKYLQNNFDEEAIALYIMADAWEEFMKIARLKNIHTNQKSPKRSGSTDQLTS